MAPRPLHPHERAYLEGYVKGCPAEQVLDQLVHDSRAAFSATRAADGAIEIVHASGSRARLVENDGLVTGVRWLDDLSQREVHGAPLAGAVAGPVAEPVADPVGAARGGASGAPVEDANGHKSKALARIVADVASARLAVGGLAEAILAADIGARTEYAPALTPWALEVLATHTRALGDDDASATLRALAEAARLGDDERGFAGALRALAHGPLASRDEGVAAALEDAAHYCSLGGLYPAFPRRLLGHLGAPAWAALMLAACALGASIVALTPGREAVLYPLAFPSAGHGVMWLEGATLAFASGSLEACLEALPPARREALLRAMPALRGARRGRIGVPKAPRIEPSCSLGRHALVGDELWLSSPQGIVARRLPHLEHARELRTARRVDALASSADGRLVATLARVGATGYCVTLLDARTLEVRLELTSDESSPPSLAPHDVALSSTGRFLVLSGSVSCLVWEVDAARSALVERAPRRFGAPAVVLPDERSLVHVGGHDLWRTRLDRPPGEPGAEARLLVMGWFASALACSADGEALALAYRRKRDEPCRVERLDLGTLARRPCFSQRTDVLGLAFSPHGELAAVDAHGELRLVDRRGRVRRHLRAGPGQVTFASGGLLVSGWARPTVLDVASGLTLASFGSPPGGAQRVEHLAFAGDVLLTETGHHLRERTRRSWDLDSGLQLGPPPTIERAFLDPRESPDGTFRVEVYETGRRMVMGDSEPVHGGVALVPLVPLGPLGPPEASLHIRLVEHPDQVVHLSVSRCAGWVLSVGGGRANVTHVPTRSTRALARDLELTHARFDAEHLGVALVGRRRDGEVEARLVTFDDVTLASWRGPVERAAGHVGAGVLVVTQAEGTLLWSRASGPLREPGPVSRDEFHRADVIELVLSPCGELLASVDRDGVVRVRSLVD